MRTSGIQLHPELGEAVLDRLSQLAPLPTHGLLAGQAVSSAILDLHGCQGGGVYNDLDVFIEIRHDTMARFKNRELTTATMTRPYDISRGEYSEMDVISKYRIAGTTRHGMINKVMIAGVGRFGCITPHSVLTTFDFNCVQVGVHLPTRKLCWTPHFERFLRTRQLEFASVHTPWHSALRLVKKLSELKGVWCDFEAAMDLLTAMTRYEDKSIPRAFGNKTLALYERYESMISPYFQIVPHQTKSGFSAHTMVPIRSASEETERLTELLGNSRWAMAAQVFYANRRKIGKRAQSRLNMALTRGGTSHRPIETFIRKNAEAFGPWYVEGEQVLEHHAELVETAIRQHNGVTHKLIGYTLAQQAAIVKGIKALAKKYGQLAWGVVETRIPADSLISMDEIERFIIERKREQKNVLVSEFLSLPMTINGFRIRELVTGGELEREGEQMRHCVGGYDWNVKQGHSRIISIRKGNDREFWSTVEVKRKDPSLPWCAKSNLVIAQHRSWRNEPARKEVGQIIEWIVAWHGHVSGYQMENGIPAWKRLQVSLTQKMLQAAGSALNALAESITRAQAQITALGKKAVKTQKAYNALRPLKIEPKQPDQRLKLPAVLEEYADETIPW